MTASPELARQYQALTDDELLRLELDAEQLATEAQVQLKAELAKRGIDSPKHREEFRAEERQATMEPKQYSSKGSGVVATVRDWQEYRGRTGEWPIYSMIASVTQGIVLLSCLLFVVVFSVKHHWPKTKFFLVLGSLLLAELWLWDRIQKKLRLNELKGYRSRRSLGGQK